MPFVCPSAKTPPVPRVFLVALWVPRQNNVRAASTKGQTWAQCFLWISHLNLTTALLWYHSHRHFTDEKTETQ